ncbi:hypothetical protein V6L77_05230 [Pannonibacter sp. Pt2-lr]
MLDQQHIAIRIANDHADAERMSTAEKIGGMNDAAQQSRRQNTQNLVHARQYAEHCGQGKPFPENAVKTCSPVMQETQGSPPLP